MNLHNHTLLELRDMIRSGETTPQAIFTHFQERSKKLGSTLGATSYIADTPAVFARPESPLAGLPLGIKDVFCEAGVVTSAGSKMIESFTPPYTGTIMDRLKSAGGYRLATCHMDEFAMGSSGENCAFGPSRNPWAQDRIPGGSSSGSAVAVAAGLVPASLGTDTGGSVRTPASLCGIVGFKPTYGRNSRYGVIAMASSLDCPGTFTRSVRDAAFLYEITAGLDPLDSTSLSAPVSINPAIWDRTDLTWVRVGVPNAYFREGLDSGVSREVRKAIDTMKSLGATIIDIELPNSDYGLAVYYIIMAAEASTNLSRYDGIRFGHTSDAPENIARNRSEGFGAEPTRRIMLGSFVLSSGFYDAYYKRAALVRELIRDDFIEAFKQVDVIVGPVVPTVAWKIGEKIADPLKMYLADVYTVPPSLAGIPGLSLPIGFATPEDGSGDTVELPVGLHMLAPHLAEERLFEVAHVLEKALSIDLQSRIPPTNN